VCWTAGQALGRAQAQAIIPPGSRGPDMRTDISQCAAVTGLFGSYQLARRGEMGGGCILRNAVYNQAQSPLISPPLILRRGQVGSLDSIRFDKVPLLARAGGRLTTPTLLPVGPPTRRQTHTPSTPINSCLAPGRKLPVFLPCLFPPAAVLPVRPLASDLPAHRLLPGRTIGRLMACVCTTYSRAASLHPQHNIQEANIGRQD